MRNLRVWLVAVALLAVILAGFLFLRGPTPVIHLAAEPIFEVGPVAVTNSMITSWIVTALIILGAWVAGRGAALVPRGFTNLVEAGLELFLNLVEQVAGRENGRRFFPVVATIFIYVLLNNWFGLLPGVNTIGKVHEEHHGAVFETTSVAGVDVAYIPPNPDEVEEAEGAAAEGHGEEAAHEEEGRTIGEVVPFLRPTNTDINAPLALAVAAVLFVQYWGVSALGVLGYGSKFFNFGNLLRGRVVDGIIDVFVGFLELVSELARMVSFTFRLFGNMFAGEVLLLVMGFLAPLVVVDIFYGLELFVGFIQAFIFAMLTLVFGVMAVAHHGGGHHEEEHGHGAEEHA
ncbi:MAG TPA: F0F1 ATP synthase subunit A [Dehalococcoidia bacterium]